MNKLLLLPLICWTMCASSTRATANDTPAVPPSPPFVKALLPGSTWSVNMTRPGERENGATSDSGKSPDLPPFPVRLEVSFGLNQILMGTITYSNHTQDKFYVADRYVLQEAKTSSEVALWPVGSIRNDLRSSSFPGVDWITSSNYVGEETVNKRECWKFQAGQGEPTSAWIDTETGYPVQVQVSTTTYQYSEITSFPNNVDLPPAYAMTLEKLSDERRALEAMKLSASH